MDEGRDPMQEFYARNVPEPPVPSDASDAQIFRIARERAGSPLKVRLFFTWGIVGMTVANLWPGEPPDPVFVVTAIGIVVGITFFYVQWGRTGAPLRLVQSWLLVLPSREDPGATLFEWVWCALTVGLFLANFLLILLR